MLFTMNSKSYTKQVKEDKLNLVYSEHTKRVCRKHIREAKLTVNRSCASLSKDISLYRPERLS